MVEVLAALTVPHSVQAAYVALTFAWQQCQNVSGNQEQCKMLNVSQLYLYVSFFGLQDFVVPIVYNVLMR